MTLSGPDSAPAAVKTPFEARFYRLAGASAVLVGMVVIVAWFARWPVLIQILPGLAPMKFNTALCFVFCGAGLVALAKKPEAAVWLGGFAAAIGLFSLLEYMTRLNLGLDELVVRDFVLTATSFPGRMSPLTASCFFFTGSGLVIAGAGHARKWRLATAGLLGCVVAVIAAMALFGYVSGIEVAYGWGAFTRMALHTSIIHLLLGAGMVAWATQASGREQFDFSRWLPVTAAVTMMTMIAFIAAVSFAQLKNSTDSRKHSYEVLLGAQNFLGAVFDTQRGMRGYILTGQKTTLDTYRAGLKNAPQQLSRLVGLTSDNPGQNARLKLLAQDYRELAAYAKNLINTADANGLGSAVQMESEGAGFASVKRTLADLQSFNNEEERLLDERSASADNSFRDTSRLLILGSAIAVVLLFLASAMASRELDSRRRAEARLRHVTSLQQAILNSANYAIISGDPAGVIATFNSTAEKWLGYSAAEVIGHATPALWHDAGEVAVRAAELSRELGCEVKPGFEVFTAKAKQGGSYENEWTLIRKDGSRFPVSLSVTAIRDEQGRITGYLGVIADITERKQRDAALAESQERFRRAFDDAPIGMTLVSLSGRWLKANKSFCDMIGYSTGELLATDFQRLTHPDDLQKDLALVGHVLAGRIPAYQMEKRYLHKDGTEIPVLLSVSLVRESDGNPLYFVAQIEDISERKRHAAERESLIGELRQALSEVKTLSGLIPICGWCKKVRSDEGYQQTVEQFVHAHTDARFSHGMCPDCSDQFKADTLRANFKAAVV